MNVVAESLRDKTAGDMGNLLNLPNLGYDSPLHKVNHTDMCLWYFHPSYRSDNRDITTESKQMYSYLY